MSQQQQQEQVELQRRKEKVGRRLQAGSARAELAVTDLPWLSSVLPSPTLQMPVTGQLSSSVAFAGPRRRSDAAAGRCVAEEHKRAGRANRL